MYFLFYSSFSNIFENDRKEGQLSLMSNLSLEFS